LCLSTNNVASWDANQFKGDLYSLFTNAYYTFIDPNSILANLNFKHAQPQEISKVIFSLPNKTVKHGQMLVELVDSYLYLIIKDARVSWFGFFQYLFGPICPPTKSYIVKTCRVKPGPRPSSKKRVKPGLRHR
jgi:hypothetical protein